jgi:DNA-binding transcriptional LysR family regulator
MALRPALDLELLRTLVCIAEEASFTKAADRVGRTQSAITLQVQKLEGLVGQSLVVRSKGGPVELTPQGKSLVESARAMLKLNDEALRAVASADAPVTVRLGASTAYLHAFLERSLQRFREQYPTALIEVTEGNSCQVTPHIRDGSFDLVVCQENHEPRGWPAIVLGREPLRWITSIERPVHLDDPLPLSLVPANCPWLPPWMDDCFWRGAALKALERANKAHRVIASSSSMEGLYAPVLAGRAVTVATARGLPPGLRALRDDEGLPPLPDDVAILIKGRSAVQPHTDKLADIIASTFTLD